MELLNIRWSERAPRPGANRCLLLAGLFFAFAPGALTAAEISKEYQVKAVFLFNFAQFTDWPVGAFADTNAPIVVGVLGADPFGKFLDNTIQNEVIRGRHMIVKRYTRVEEIKSCHILYVSDSEANRLDHVLAVLRRKPVLTVSDIEAAADRGVIIQFETTHGRVRFRINVDAAKTADLTLSSKLLRVAVPLDQKQ
jgi:hypothetical protein